MRLEPGRFAVIGDPISHSASPRLFAALGRALGTALDYGAIRVTEAELPSFLQEARAGAYRGLSVTSPHKESVLELVESVTEVARRVGAANTIAVLPGKKLEAHSTDGVGLVHALGEHGVTLAGGSVMVLGAGGAARAAVQASLAAGARTVHVANRTPARAEALARALGARAVELDRASLQPLLDAATVLIQATSAELSRPGETPLPAGCVLHPELTVLDMVYQPRETTLLRAAREAGARTVDGLWMLVHQGLEQFRCWTGTAVPAGIARRLHGELARGQA